MSGRGKETSLISPVCEGKEPREHARKRLMQAAQGLSKCYSVMSLFPSQYVPSAVDRSDEAIGVAELGVTSAEMAIGARKG